jgi:hypothetical protein
MTPETQQPEPITKKRIVYTLPEVAAVMVRRDREYRASDTGPLTMDLYYPGHCGDGALLPAVVIVAGYADGAGRPGAGSFKNMGWTVSWAEAIAASGMVAVTYTNRHAAEDAAALLAHVRGNAAAIGIDESRIGLLAGSGNAPVALSLLMRNSAHHPRCGVLCYPLLLDADGATCVADAAATYGFANACAGRSVADLQADVPLLIVRAAEDQFPHLNDTLDRFVLDAATHQLPITLVDHQGPHAFDLLQDTDASRATITRMLAFLRVNLGVVPAPA